jgi:hypothetical protein
LIPSAESSGDELDSVIEKSPSVENLLRSPAFGMPLNKSPSAPVAPATRVPQCTFVYSRVRAPTDAFLASVPGLNASGNPLVDQFSTPLEFELLATSADRDVDWRGDVWKPCHTRAQSRAAYVQQAGVRVPDEHKCTKCGKGDGPFETCVFMIAGKNPVFGGACANCAFQSGGSNCSFRMLMKFPIIEQTLTTL